MRTLLGILKNQAANIALGVGLALLIGAVLFPPAHNDPAQLDAARLALDAERLAAQLEALRHDERQTERVIHTETIKPVFRNVCATDEYVRLLNDHFARAERTLSGRTDDPVPDHPATPSGGDG